MHRKTRKSDREVAAMADTRTRGKWLSEIPEDVRGKLDLLGATLGLEVAGDVLIVIAKQEVLMAQADYPAVSWRRKRPIPRVWWDMVLASIAEINRIHHENSGS
jgi:hypothetical protein